MPELGKINVKGWRFPKFIEAPLSYYINVDKALRPEQRCLLGGSSSGHDGPWEVAPAGGRGRAAGYADSLRLHIQPLTN